MNSFQIDNQAIELVFQNTECVYVDIWAIEYFTMSAGDTDYTWLKDHKHMEYSRQLTKFNLTLNLSDPRHFYRTPRMVKPETTAGEDGKYCIRRLANGNDLVHIYINGICYALPWEYREHKTALGIPVYTNDRFEVVENNGKLNMKLLADCKISEEE